jgi:hypothetical protein
MLAFSSPDEPMSATYLHNDSLGNSGMAQVVAAVRRILRGHAREATERFSTCATGVTFTRLFPGGRVDLRSSGFRDTASLALCSLF